MLIFFFRSVIKHRLGSLAGVDAPEDQIQMMTVTKPMSPMNRRNPTTPIMKPMHPRLTMSVMKPTHPTMPVMKPTKSMNTRDLTTANLRNAIRR